MAEVVKISDALKIAGMASPEPLTDNSVSMIHRLTDAQLAEAERAAAAPLPALPPCAEQHFGQCLRIMIAALPRQNSDDVSGELFVAAYRRKLGHMPEEQISFLADQALGECRWFPTIAQCLEIAGRWERSDEHTQRRGRARAAVREERQQRMEEAMSALERFEMTQEQFDALPDQWMRIADARGLVRWTAEGLKVRQPAPAITDETAA